MMGLQMMAVPSVPVDYASTILATPGLVHYYKCDETTGSTLYDSKGSEDLTCGGTYALGVAGPWAGQLGFDTNAGATGYSATGYAQTTSHVGVADGGAFTYEFWVYLPRAINQVALVGETGAEDAMGAYGTGTSSEVVSIVRKDGSIVRTANSSANIQDGDWHMVWMVGTTFNNVVLYVDDPTTVDGGPPSSGGTSVSTTAFGLGAPMGPYANKGASLSHVAVYNVALDEATRTAHKNAAIREGAWQ